MARPLNRQDPTHVVAVVQPVARPVTLGRRASAEGPEADHAAGLGVPAVADANVHAAKDVAVRSAQVGHDERLVDHLDREPAAGFQGGQHPLQKRQVVGVREVAETAEPVEGGVELAVEVDPAHVAAQETGGEALAPGQTPGLPHVGGRQVYAGHLQTHPRQGKGQPALTARDVQDAGPLADLEQPLDQAGLLQARRVVKLVGEDVRVEAAEELLVPRWHGAAPVLRSPSAYGPAGGVSRAVPAARGLHARAAGDTIGRGNRPAWPRTHA